MYQVLIYDGGQTIDAGDGLIAGTIVEAVNEFASFTFTLLPASSAYNYIHPMQTLVEVLNEGTRVYYGRVLTETPKMAQSGLIQKDIVCESQMAYLCDSIQPYTPERQYDGDANRNGLQEFIDVLLANHNAQVEAYKQIQRGNVTVTTYESSEGVYKGLNYETTWDAIKNKLLNVFGGEIRVRETSGVLYLDYAESLGTTHSSSIELRKNMLTAEHTLNPSAVVSRLIPLGAKLTVDTYDDDGNLIQQETEERLTINEVNSDLNYLESAAALALYGIQYQTMTWDDVHDPLILKNRGLEYLTIQNKALMTYSINALDLSWIGEAVDALNLYDKYPVRNDAIGISDTLEIVRKSTNIFQPWNPSLTFGDKSISLSAIVTGNINQIAVDAAIENKAETTLTNGINNIYTFINTTATSLEQNTNSLIATVEENTVSKSLYDEFSETVRNILQMDADGTTMIFQTIQEQISAVDDAQSSNYAEILKYIRFENGTITLGEMDNPITLTLDNDMLAFQQNGTTVAYLSNNRFYVTDGEFETSLRIGKFQFVPRNNGNLSFMKVGD